MIRAVLVRICVLAREESAPIGYLVALYKSNNFKNNSQNRQNI